MIQRRRIRGWVDPTSPGESQLGLNKIFYLFLFFSFSLPVTELTRERKEIRDNDTTANVQSTSDYVNYEGVK